MTTVSELVDKGDIPEEHKDNVKKVLHDLGYGASRAVGKAFLKITKKDMTDAGMSIADANAILAEVEPLQGTLDRSGGHGQDGQTLGMTTAFADDPLQKLSSNIEVQTHAVLRLGKAINSMASSFRAAKSNQFVYTPSNASSMRDPSFKLELIKAYQRSSYDEDEDKPCKTCKCMLLGVTLPTSYVTGSHLFKFKWHMAVQEVLGFSCINDTRNGLLLAKPIEEAFDAGFLCFILGEDGEHRLHLLDARLCNVKLTDMKAYPWLKPPVQEKMAKESKQQDIMKDVTQALKESFGDIPTFAALQGKQLQFEGDQRPFKRCLAFQASQSRHSALSQGRISPSAIPEIDASAWSHNSYLERIKDYLADPELQYQVGPIDRLDNISELDKLEDSG